jgi:hypothetical protein
MRFPVFLPALFLLLALGGCADAGNRSAEVEGFRLLREAGDQRVVGELVNTGEAPIEGADLTVALYGAENTVLGEARVTLNADLAAGERKAFEQTLDVDFQAQAARVRQILVY